MILCLNKLARQSVKILFYQSCNISIICHVKSTGFEWIPCRKFTGHIGNIRTYSNLLLTDIFHSETVILIVIGDVVLAAELHAVGDPNGRVVHVKETLPVRIYILWTLLPFAGWRTKKEGSNNKRRRSKGRNDCQLKVITFYQNSHVCTQTHKVLHTPNNYLDLKVKCVQWQPHSLLLKIEDSECSRVRQVVEAAWTPPTAERLLVPWYAVCEMRLKGSWKKIRETKKGKAQRQNEQKKLVCNRLLNHFHFNQTTS